MRRFAVLLITLALIAGMVGCVADPVHDPDPEPDPDPDIRHELSISATIGGSVTSPGEGTFEYDASTVVFLYAVPDECYSFVNWTGDTVANPASAVTTVTMDADKSITANFELSQYNLRVRSRVGGVVISPSEEESEHDCGTVVDLVAEAEEGYQFTQWTGTVGSVSDVNAASTTVTMMGDYSITANFVKEIRNWHDLDAIRDNLSGHYILVNDLDPTTAGYEELAGPTANEGRGWEPVGSLLVDPDERHTIDAVDVFTGTLDGQGYQIRDLFISRRDQDGIGLFGFLGEAAVAQNLELVNAEVAGRSYIGGVVGHNRGHVGNLYCSGSVTGEFAVGGLVGVSVGGTVSKSSYTGSVAGDVYVGGLVGHNGGIVSNSYYDLHEVLINGRNTITIGALFKEDFEQWLAGDKLLDVKERLSQEDGFYVINSLSDFKELLAFGQDGSLKFRLQNDLDLLVEPNFYVPYLAGVFDGNGHKISNLSLNLDSASQVGLFGYIASGGTVTGVGVENADVIGYAYVGGLAGWSRGHISNSYTTGSVTGQWGVGGVVGALHQGTVSSCHYIGNVAGSGWGVGGLLGDNYGGTLSNSHFNGSVAGSEVGGLVGSNHGVVSNSYYNHDEVFINGRFVITVGALSNKDFQQWLANDKSLDVNERLSREDGYYLIEDVSDFKQLLSFGQDASLKFRLTVDIDLASDPDFYVPYLAGEFDGKGYRISNLSVTVDFVSEVGVFGYVGAGGKVTNVGAESVKVRGVRNIGGLVGGNAGIVSGSYSTGTVSGWWHVGGLVGVNEWCGDVSNSYSGSIVTAAWEVGGLVGRNHGTVSNSYSAGSVTGSRNVGGLVGQAGGTIRNSFWDRQTSGVDMSDGGTGKTTVEMKDIATFRTAGWSIVGVAGGETDRSHTWNIIDGQAYPFLSWQQVP